MNPTLLLWLILGFLLLEPLLDTLADGLHLRAFPRSAPPEFQDQWDETQQKKSLAYQRDQFRYLTFQRWVSFSLLVIWSAAGGFGALDDLVRDVGMDYEMSIVGIGLLFWILLITLQSFVRLPFSWYSTFHLEAKFGFNRTTPRTFILDRIKGALVGLLLGLPLLAGILWFFSSVGSQGWIGAWIFVSLFQLIIGFVAPVLLLPLFNRFTPLPEDTLRSRIQGYAKEQNFQLGGIFVMDGSKRSNKANAFFTGFGRFRKLVLFDTLINRSTENEILAIVAHEMGHFICRHIPKTLILSIAGQAVLFFAFSQIAFYFPLQTAFGIEIPSVYAGLFLASILFSPLSRMIGIPSHALSRKHEYEADSFSIHTFQQPEALISGLKKLSLDHLSHLTPHRLKVLLDYTHPPILERIRAIRSAKSM